MDLIDSYWNKPFSSLADNSRVHIEGAPDVLTCAFAETDIDEDDDYIVFGIDYDFGFEIIQDDLHDSLYLGEMVRTAGRRSHLLVDGQEALPFTSEMSFSDTEEVPLKIDAASTRMRDFLIELLSSERYGIDRELLTEALEVGDTGADGNRIEISLGIRANVDLTVGEVYDKYVWPFFAAVANSTDPGTFNHSYWASEVSRAIEAEELEGATA